MAATAAPSYFSAHRDAYDGRIFVDAGIVANNPCIALEEDIRWPQPHRSVGLLVSIGTGGTSSVTSSHSFRGLLNLLKGSVSNTRNITERAAEQYGDAFYLLEIENGLHHIALDDYSKMLAMKSFVEAAMKRPETRRKLQDIITRYDDITTGRYHSKVTTMKCHPIYCLAV